MEVLQAAADIWAKRTQRERMLAMIVAGMIAFFCVLLGVRSALATLHRLDGEISRMQSDIVNYSYQIARRQAVESRYQEVAAQHSSAWSESEIRDRLRQEIYRLRYRKPPRLDANGIPVSTESEGEVLVRIPELRGGQLIEGGDGYRAFQLEFEVEPAPFLDMLAYLEYLQESPQSLRVDWINLRRDPQRPEVDARIRLTRTVVDDPSGGAESASIRAETVLALRAEDWTGEHCRITRAEEGGEAVLRFEGDGTGGRAYLERALPAGALYEVQVEVIAGAELTLGIWRDGAMAPGAESLPATGAYSRCRFQFRVPDAPGGRATVGVPCIAWPDGETVAKLRKLRIAPIEEAPDGT